MRSSGRSLGIVDFLLPPGGLSRRDRGAPVSAGGSASVTSWPARSCSASAAAVGSVRAVWFNPPPVSSPPRRSLDVSAVTDRQFAVVRSFLLRVQDLVPEARFAMALRLSTPIAAAMHHRSRAACTRSSSSSAWPRPTSAAARASLLPRRRRHLRRGPSPPTAGPRLRPPPPPPPPAGPLVPPHPPPPRRRTGRGRVADDRPAGELMREHWHYLDHAATTPLRPEAVAAMVPALDATASATRRVPTAGPRRPDRARRRPGASSPAVVGCTPARSSSPAAAPRPTTWPSAACSAPAADRWSARAIEHHAVLDPRARSRRARRAGRRARRHRPRRAGRHARRRRRLVSVMLVNNEVGTIQPLAAIAPRSCASRAPGRAAHRCRAGAELARPAGGRGSRRPRHGRRPQVRWPQGHRRARGARRRGLEPCCSAVGRSASGAAAPRTWPARSVSRRPPWRPPTAVRPWSPAPVRWRDRAGRRRARRRSRARSRARCRRADRAHLVAGHRQRLPARRRQRGPAVPARARPGVLAGAASSCASGAQEPSHVLAALGVEPAVAAGSLRLSPRLVDHRR